MVSFIRGKDFRFESRVISFYSRLARHRSEIVEFEWHFALSPCYTSDSSDLNCHITKGSGIGRVASRMGNDPSLTSGGGKTIIASDWCIVSDGCGDCPEPHDGK